MQIMITPEDGRRLPVNLNAMGADIRELAAAGDEDSVRQLAMGAASMAIAALEFDVHAALLDDDGTLIWQGWMSGEDKPAPGPAAPGTPLDVVLPATLAERASRFYDAHTAELRASRPLPPRGSALGFDYLGPRAQSAWLAAARVDEGERDARRRELDEVSRAYLDETAAWARECDRLRLLLGEAGIPDLAAPGEGQADRARLPVTDEPAEETPGYWHVRAALTTAVTALSLISVCDREGMAPKGGLTELAGMASGALAAVDASLGVTRGSEPGKAALKVVFDTPGRPTTSLEDAMLGNIDGLHDLVRDMLQAFPDTADEQEWRDRAGALDVRDPDGKPYRAYTEADL